MMFCCWWTSEFAVSRYMSIIKSTIYHQSWTGPAICKKCKLQNEPCEIIIPSALQKAGRMVKVTRCKKKDWEMMRTTTIKLWTQIHHGLLMQWLLSEWTGKRARSCGERWLEKCFLAPLPPFFSRSSCTTCKKKTYSMETFTRRNSSTTHSGSWARLDHQLACSQSLAHHHAALSSQKPATEYCPEFAISSRLTRWLAINQLKPSPTKFTTIVNADTTWRNKARPPQWGRGYQLGRSAHWRDNG